MISWKSLSIVLMFVSFVATLVIATRRTHMEQVTVTRSTGVSDVPTMDAEAPTETETATFGLG